jgi:hypothetical protein
MYGSARMAKISFSLDVLQRSVGARRKGMGVAAQAQR